VNLKVPALEKERQLGMVNTKTVKDRGLDMVNVDVVGDDVVAEIVGLADHSAGLEPAVPGAMVNTAPTVPATRVLILLRRGD
jgi:hypothetical protein